MIKQATSSLKKHISNVDWKLLMLLVLFLNIKLPVKILAIVVIYAFQFNFKFGFKLKNSRLPLFYLLIIPIAILGFFINNSHTITNYILVFLTGIGFWLLCILAVHQIKLIVEQTDILLIHQTIIVFFIINAIISLGNLALIIWETHNFNPYTFRGLHQTYFINTGDFIKGITFDISPTSAALNAMGVIYFMYKKNPAMIVICQCTLLLTYCNLVNLILLFILGLLFVFKSNANQKSMIVVCVMLFGVFMIKVSPQNKNYVTQVIYSSLHIKNPNPVTMSNKVVPLAEKPDSMLSSDEKKQKFAMHYLDSVNAVYKAVYLKKHPDTTSAFLKHIDKIAIPQPDTNALEFRLSADIEPDRLLLLQFIKTHKKQLYISGQENYHAKLPGKAEGLIQTVNYLKQHPRNIIAGLGVGNFSSKLAFRASGLGLRGQYPKNHTYINPAFLSNHLDLYINYFSKEIGLHSVTNNPFSVYDQLLAEYGLLGLLALLIFYLGFFLKQYKKLTYGLPLLLFIFVAFFIDYWFEQLSIIVMFELMLFLNVKESEALTENNLSHD